MRDEFLNEIKKMLKSKKLLKYLIIIVTILFILFLYFLISTPKTNIENIKPMWENSNADINAFKQGKESELTSDTNYSSVEAAVTLFFYLAQEGEVDLFSSSMHYDQFQKDFFKYDVTERYSKIEEALNRISRDGKLENIEVVKNGWVFQPDTVRLVVDLFYEDRSEPVRVSVLVAGEDEYEAETDEKVKVYYIISSVWEVIRNIEGKV